MADIRKLSTNDGDFDAQLEQLLAWESVSDDAVNDVVKQVIADIRSRGDLALMDFTNRFDGWEAKAPSDLAVSVERLKQAWEGLSAEQQQALQHAADRVKAYAEHQKMDSWQYTEADGTVLGQKVTPLDRVGLYVPGGKAAYPSSVLMNALPAKVAGVKELVMVVPTPRGEVNELVLAAAHVCGVDKVFAGWCASGCGTRIWHRVSTLSRQDCWPWQHLCCYSKANCLWPGGHRYDRRSFGDLGYL